MKIVRSLLTGMALTAVSISSAHAFSVTNYWAGGSYQYELTADGGTIYRSNGSSTINKYDKDGNSLGSFTVGRSRSLGAAGGKMVTKYGTGLQLWDLGTETLAASVTTTSGRNHGLAYDPVGNRAFFGTATGYVDWYDFDTDTNGTLGFIGNPDGSSHYFEDLEVAGGFLWVVDGHDSDILKFTLDGSYIGKETTNAGLHIEGFGYDETTASFWAHSYYTPDFGPNNGQRGYYVQELGGFTKIKPPAPPTTSVPEPTSLALMGLGFVALGGFRKKRNV